MDISTRMHVGLLAYVLIITQEGAQSMSRRDLYILTKKTHRICKRDLQNPKKRPLSHQNNSDSLNTPKRRIAYDIDTLRKTIPRHTQKRDSNFGYMHTFACVGAHGQCRIESKETYRMLSIKRDLQNAINQKRLIECYQSKETYRMLSIKRDLQNAINQKRPIEYQNTHKRLITYAKETHKTHKRHPYAYVYILDLFEKSDI